MEDERPTPILLQGERLVFEAEGWSIIIDDDADTPAVYGSHKDCNSESKWGYMSWELEGLRASGEENLCAFCHEPVPECIVTLVKIEDWNR